MDLSQLPTEILWIISSYLSRQNDVYAFVRTNRHLYQELGKCLPYWNAQYDHGSALAFTAEYNLLPQLKNLLVGLLNVARTKPHSRPRDPTQVSQLAGIRHGDPRYSYLCKWNLNTEGEIDSEWEEELEWEEERRRSDPYWEDIYTHRLSSQGHCFESIINIQHALALAIQAGNTEIVQTLLKFGAEINFYRGSRTANPFPMFTDKARHSSRVKIDNPPLFIAVQYGHTELVNNLLDCGADPQRYTPSPLYRAVEDDRRDIVSILLKRDIRSQKSAIKLASLRENYAMVEFLLCNGLNAAEHGHVSLYVAEMKGYKEMADLLRRHGASFDTLSNRDREDWQKEDRDGTDRPHHFFQSCIPSEDYPDDTEAPESESETNESM
ncbi:hypothetical protein N7509_004160 [Penicillium cosmopolitanum]|uniref:Uncharacterized protein n=1 Tax=Penicillium cosmopolitanum TaxID=1131564 RepID=A0A9W9W6B5_9EURO|nr:uncharacterized protein N7509_004160 [Penicillium cosmopolitanum]KAJ5404289.1 hypothetical protein N7509_004160 [Penicillium cosmopolitanum]